MSALLMGKVWELDLPHNKQLVLLALADHAQDDGTDVFPSIGRIAWKTGYSYKQTSRIMSALEKDGLIQHVNTLRDGRKEYVIVLSSGVAKEPFSSGKEHRSNTVDKMSTPDDGQNVHTPMDTQMSTPYGHPDVQQTINNHQDNHQDMTALIFQAFAEVGELTALVADDLSDLIEEHGEIEVLEAVKSAVSEKPSKPLAWIASVLGENTTGTDEATPLVKAYCEAVNMIGHYEPKGKERTAFQEMEAAGVTPEQLKQFVASKSQEEYWRGKRISPVVCARDIGAFIQFKLVKFEKPVNPKDRPGWQFTFEN